jgi:hypothetical protein
MAVFGELRMCHFFEIFLWKTQKANAPAAWRAGVAGVERGASGYEAYPVDLSGGWREFRLRVEVLSLYEAQ